MKLMRNEFRISRVIYLLNFKSRVFDRRIHYVQFINTTVNAHKESKHRPMEIPVITSHFLPDMCAKLLAYIFVSILAQQV